MYFLFGSIDECESFLLLIPYYDLMEGKGMRIRRKRRKARLATGDVCKTPTPSGPIPIPYPKFAKSSDTIGGSKTVNISGKEVGIKGRSRFKKSEGDEPSTG